MTMMGRVWRGCDPSDSAVCTNEPGRGSAAVTTAVSWFYAVESPPQLPPVIPALPPSTHHSPYPGAAFPVIPPSTTNF